MKTKILLLVFLIGIAGLAFSQPVSSLEELENHYKASAELPLDIAKCKGINQIILIRHGEPNLNKKGCRTRKQAAQFIQDYAAASVVPFEHGPIKTETLAVDTIYHSTLARAKHTTELAFGADFTLLGMDRFQEFEARIWKGLNIKLPLKFWTISSRMFWVMGCNHKGIESFQEAKLRARQNAEFLGNETSNKKTVILVAHGFHNRYVVKYLKKMGWEKVYDNGHDYLSMKVMAKSQK